MNLTPENKLTIFQAPGKICVRQRLLMLIIRVDWRDVKQSYCGFPCRLIRQTLGSLYRRQGLTSTGAHKCKYVHRVVKSTIDRTLVGRAGFLYRVKYGEFGVPRIAF